MRITRQQLKQIIREEVSFANRGRRSLVESNPSVRYKHEWANGSRATLTWIDTGETRDDATVVFGEGDPTAPQSNDTVTLEFDDEPGEEYMYERRGKYWFEVNNSTVAVRIVQS